MTHAQRAAVSPKIPNARSGDHGRNAPKHMDFQARIIQIACDALHQNGAKLVKNTTKLVEAATRLIDRSGPCLPIFAQADGTILAGGEVLQAYRELGYKTVPAIHVDHLTKAESRAFQVAVIKYGQMPVFDEKVLADELRIILDTPDLIRMTPFSMAEVDQHLAASALLAAIPDVSESDPEVAAAIVSQFGDLWHFDDGSRLLHGDSCKLETVSTLFAGDLADFVCTDPPYGIAIASVSERHDEFVQGSDVSEEQISVLFRDFLRAMRPHLRDGCMIDTFIDDRRLFALMSAHREAGLEQKAICTWDKELPGMGAPYRNVAEYVIVSKYGTAGHIDNIQLGRYGRNRSTIWRVPGYAGFGRDREEALARHPTSKPVALIADAILDFSNAGGIVYDAFLGSGTTLIAAERTRRRCYGIELDGRYLDTSIRRMEEHTGRAARHAASGLTFTEVAIQRANGTNAPLFRSRKRPSSSDGSISPAPEIAAAANAVNVSPCDKEQP